MTAENPGPLHPLAEVNPIIHAPARLMIVSYLYVVESADAVFLQRMTGLTWGNLSSHLARLEDAGYVALDKSFVGRKPHTTIRLTATGREELRRYKRNMRRALDDLPD